MENIASGGDVYNCDVSLLSSHSSALHRQDVAKNFSVSHLLELQGAGNLYHAHSTLLDHHRVGPILKIPEGRNNRHFGLFIYLVEDEYKITENMNS